MSAQAIRRGVRISPRKVGVVAALVRGRTISDALVILGHTPRHAALEVKEAVKSAGANAEHNHQYKPDTLFITEISVTPGPRLKRWKKGRGYRGGMDPFARKTSHIRVVVDGQKRVPKKATAKATSTEKTEEENK